MPSETHHIYPEIQPNLITLCDGYVWSQLTQYCHPTTEIHPLNVVIDRVHQWHDPSNENGIKKHWEHMRNFMLGQGS